MNIRNIARRSVNTPSSICVTFTNGSSSFAYVGAGAYSTEMGERHLSLLFREEIPILFGEYGKEEKLPITTLYGQDDAELYFASQTILDLCRDTLTDRATTKIADDLEIWFNR